jgi:hypothetical protein
VAIDESLPAEEQLHHFIIERLKHLLDPARPKWHGQLMAREMSSPTRSLDLLVRELILPRIAIFGRIVSAIAGRGLPERRLAMLLLSVIGQCVYYRQSAPIIETLFPNLMKTPGVITEIAEHIAAFSVAGIPPVAKQNFDMSTVAEEPKSIPSRVPASSTRLEEDR